MNPATGARLWLLAAVAIVFVTYAPQLEAPFELQDDHRIIAPLIHPHDGALASWLASIRTDFDVVGRFRPVNQVFDVIGPLLLGPNPRVWHGLSLVLALAVTVLLFDAARVALASAPAAFVFAILTLLAPDPGPTAAWYRLGPKEAWGMLFLAAALVVMVRRGPDWLAFALAALCALSKEPFVLLVPALFGVHVYFSRRNVRTLAVAYGALFAIGLAGIALAVRGAGARSYGAQSLTLTPADMLRAALADVVRAPTLAAWFVPVVLALFLWPRGKPLLWGALLFAAWAGPQYALYATRGGMWDHYWLPCVVAFAAVNAAAIALLARQPRPILYRVAMAVVALWTINAMRIDFFAVRNFREKARVQQETVRLAAEAARPDAILVVAADAKTQAGEVAPAFADFVRARGGRYAKAVMYDVRCSADCALREFGTNAVVVPRPGEVGAVVSLFEAHQPMQFSGGWYDPAAFERRPVTGARDYLSLRKRGLVTIPFGLRVDVRRL